METEKNFIKRAAEHLQNHPEQAGRLTVRLRKMSEKKFLKHSFQLHNLIQEIEDEKSVCDPKPINFWNKTWFVLKKILILLIGISVIVFTAYLMSGFKKSIIQSKPEQRTNQIIPANHVNDRGEK